MIKFINLKKLSFDFVIIIKKNTKFIVTLVCLFFLGLSIFSNWNDLANQTIDFNAFLWLFAAIIFSFLSILINAFAWHLLIESLGIEKNKLNIIKIFLNTNIYKYLPGGIWHFISRFNILRSDLSIEKSVESILLEPLLMLVSAIIYIPLGTTNLYFFMICWISPLIFLTSFRSFLIENLKAIKSSIFSNSKELNEINLNHVKNTKKTKYPYRALLVESLFVLVRFLGFLSCLNAFSIGSLISLGVLISGFSIAWILGLIVPAAPGGLGVFETAILFNLATNLPEAPLLASLLFYRLVSTFADVLAALIYPTKKIFLRSK